MDGKVGFDKFEIDNDIISKYLKKKFNALIVRVKNLVTAPGFEIESEGISKKEIEEKTFRELIEIDSRFKDKEGMFKVFCDVKDMVLRRAEPKEIAELLKSYSKNADKQNKA